jgi:hypothetical protein
MISKREVQVIRLSLTRRLADLFGCILSKARSTAMYGGIYNTMHPPHLTHPQLEGSTFTYAAPKTRMTDPTLLTKTEPKI